MRSMKFGESAAIYLKVCLQIMFEYGAEVKGWARDPKVCGSRHAFFSLLIGQCSVHVKFCHISVNFQSAEA